MLRLLFVIQIPLESIMEKTAQQLLKKISVGELSQGISTVYWHNSSSQQEPYLSGVIVIIVVSNGHAHTVWAPVEHVDYPLSESIIDHCLYLASSGICYLCTPVKHRLSDSIMQNKSCVMADNKEGELVFIAYAGMCGIDYDAAVSWVLANQLGLDVIEYSWDPHTDVLEKWKGINVLVESMA
jgi:hypothetical protein